MADVESTAHSAADEARQAGRSEPIRVGARLGTVSNGLVHLLVAWLALHVAWGESARADQNGALSTIAAQPFGRALLWVLFAGFACIVIWRLTTAAGGYRYVTDHRKRLVKRVKALGPAIVYTVLAVLTATTAVRGQSQGNGSSQATAGLLGLPGGQVVVALVGIGVVVTGGYFVRMGATMGFTDEQDLAGADPRARTIDMRAGQVGYVAKGVAIAVVGVMVVVAAVRFDPQQANGLDAALKALAAQPFGTVLLTAVALGIAAFGVFCFFDARYHRV